MYGPGRLRRGATLSSRRADSARQAKQTADLGAPGGKKSTLGLRRRKVIHVVQPLLTLQLTGDNSPARCSLLKPWDLYRPLCQKHATITLAKQLIATNWLTQFFEYMYSTVSLEFDVQQTSCLIFVTFQ